MTAIINPLFSRTSTFCYARKHNMIELTGHTCTELASAGFQYLLDSNSQPIIECVECRQVVRLTAGKKLKADWLKDFHDCFHKDKEDAIAGKSFDYDISCELKSDDLKNIKNGYHGHEYDNKNVDDASKDNEKVNCLLLKMSSGNTNLCSNGNGNNTNNNKYNNINDSVEGNNNNSSNNKNNNYSNNKIHKNDNNNNNNNIHKSTSNTNNSTTNTTNSSSNNTVTNAKTINGNNHNSCHNKDLRYIKADVSDKPTTTIMNSCSNIDDLSPSAEQIEYYQKLKAENEKLREQRRCKICLYRDMDTVLLPCGHFIGCSECIAKIDRCALCRVIIRGTVLAFLGR